MDHDDALLDYLQGKLAPGVRARFEEDMAADPALAVEVAVMRAARGNLADAPRHERADAVWAKLSATIDPPRKAANPNRIILRQLVRYAAVAVLGVVSWQVAPAPLVSDRAPVFRTATENGDDLALQVRFADGATMSDITALLSEIDGAITDGPSALGLMRLPFEDEESQRHALDALRGRAALVDFVQAP